MKNIELQETKDRRKDNKFRNKIKLISKEIYKKDRNKCHKDVRK